MKECPKCGEPLDTPAVRRQIGVTLDLRLLKLLAEYKVVVSQVLAFWEYSKAPMPKPYKYVRSAENIQVVCTVSEDLYNRIQTCSGVGSPSSLCRGIIFENVALTSLM